MAVGLSLVASVPAPALFHIAVIDEVMSACGDDPSFQYVEIRTTSAGQVEVADTRLAAFSCDGSVVNRLLLVPGNIGNGVAGARWIIGSPAFEARAGIAPDFVMSDADPGIFPNCGQICWGAPGVLPPDPSTWDPTDPANYVDCVAYGPYTGPLRFGAGDPLTILPNNGSQSLTRTGPSAFDNAFALATPSPTNNAGQAGTVTGCSPAGGGTTTTTTVGGGGGTTSTTTTGGGTTSTTVGPALSGGGAKTDCFGEWRVAGATGTKPTVRCTDNDPSCDQSPAAGCVIRAQLCFNDASQPMYRGKCTASPVTAFATTGKVDPTNAAAISAALAGLPGAQAAAGGATFATPLGGLACTGAIDLTVPLEVKGTSTRTKKGSVTIKSVVTAGKRDKDKLKLLCLP